MRIGIGGGAFGLRGGISNKGFGLGAGPISVGGRWPRGRRRNSGNGSALGALILLVLFFWVIYFLMAWPYLLGAWIAVQAGAHNPSTARSVVGWLLEAPYLTFILAVGVVAYRECQRERSGQIRAALQAAYPSQPYLWTPQPSAKQQRRAERVAAIDALRQRADQQHAAYLADDPRGIYGQYTPAPLDE